MFELFLVVSVLLISAIFVAVMIENSQRRQQQLHQEELNNVAQAAAASRSRTFTMPIVRSQQNQVDNYYNIDLDPVEAMIGVTVYDMMANNGPIIDTIPIVQDGVTCNDSVSDDGSGSSCDDSSPYDSGSDSSSSDYSSSDSGSYDSGSSDSGSGSDW